MNNKAHILVIGAGVAGLTTAFTLSTHGYHVTVLFEKTADQESSSSDLIVSQVAGAAWAIPVKHELNVWKDRETDNIIQKWAMKSYHRFSELEKNRHQTGVYLRDHCYVSKYKMEKSSIARKLIDAHKHIPGSRHSQQLLQEKGISGPGLVDCFAYQGITVDTDIYLRWLKHQCESLGVRFYQETVSGLLVHHIQSLKQRYRVGLVVNCSGLRARELTGDTNLYPGMGAAFVVNKPVDKHNFILDSLHSWNDQEFDANGHILVVPRGEDKLWIGTLTCSSKASELHKDHPAIQRVLNEAICANPEIQDIIAGQEMSLIIGARPMRRGGPRVQKDPECPTLIHNYGHSALGFVLSWGCAEEVLHIVQNNLALVCKL